MRYLLALLLLAGCGSSDGFSGVYQAESGQQRIRLNADGTFRTMYGERTSPADQTGTYRREGDTLILTPSSGSEMRGTVGGDGFTLGTVKFRR